MAFRYQTTANGAVFLTTSLVLLCLHLGQNSSLVVAFAPATTKTKRSKVVTNGCGNLKPYHTRLTAKDDGASDGHDKTIFADETTFDDFYEDYDAVPLWRIEEVDTVGDPTLDSEEVFPNPLSQKDNIPDSWFVDPDDAVAARVNVDVHQTCIIDQEAAAPAFVLAGPRKEIAFDPELSRAAIVTCGGLCPGLNTVGKLSIKCVNDSFIPKVFEIICRTDKAKYCYCSP